MRTHNLALARLAQIVQRHNAVSPRPKRKRARIVIPRSVFPGAAERRYAAILGHVVERMLDQVRERLLPALSRLADQAQSMRPNAAKLDDWTDDLDSIMSTILRLSMPPDDDTDSILASIALDISESQLTSFKRQIKVAFGTDAIQIPQPWIREQFNSFRKENVKLVKSIPEEYLDKLAAKLHRDFRTGRDHREIAKDIAETFDVPRNRAKTIARTSTAQLNGELTRLRSEEMSITHYRWIATDDDRVRPNHLSKDGQVFAWADPPSDTGHPGTSPNCRCSSAMIVDDLLLSLGVE